MPERLVPRLLLRPRSQRCPLPRLSSILFLQASPRLSPFVFPHQPPTPPAAAALSAAGLGRGTAGSCLWRSSGGHRLEPAVTGAGQLMASSRPGAPQGLAGPAAPAGAAPPVLPEPRQQRASRRCVAPAELDGSFLKTARTPSRCIFVRLPVPPPFPVLLSLSPWWKMLGYAIGFCVASCLTAPFASCNCTYLSLRLSPPAYLRFLGPVL